MIPKTVKTESHVDVQDSCNNCCCFQWRKKPKSAEKAAAQASKISKQESPRRAERSVTQLHLDASMSDDVEIVMDYTVAKDK